VLPAAHRLTDPDLFRRAARSGTRQATSRIVVHVTTVSEPVEARVGFVVSKAVGTAVVRTRVKRRLRHAARESLSELPGSTVLVVRALPAAATASYAELAADLARCLERARA
jgi:ribonuclease P protein component